MTEQPDLPSKRTLLEATGIAAFVALAVLGLFILPAEYGIDPTGFGTAIGITGIAAPDDSGASIHSVEDTPYRTDSVEITVPAGVGLEYKFQVEQGSGFVYSWNASAPMYYDFHGEPGAGAYFESYQDGTAGTGDGSFHAPFAGTHGWYWRNDTTADVTVTLDTAGHYEIVGLV